MSSRISGSSWRSCWHLSPTARGGGSRSAHSTMRDFRRFTAEPPRPSCRHGASLPPEPFFSRPGIDRADLVRTQPERLTQLVAAASSLQLVWADGLPAIGGDGQLQWQAVTRPDIFLGISDGIACFSELARPHANPRAAFDTMGLLTANDAPLFASALSLASWHSRSRYSVLPHVIGTTFGNQSAAKVTRSRSIHLRRTTGVFLLSNRRDDFPTRCRTGWLRRSMH